MKKIILIISLLAFIGLSIVFVKFAGLFTPRNSFIKKYSYTGRVNEFISNVQRLSKVDPNIVSKVTDTTGTIQNGYNIYIDVELKNSEHDFLYTIVCSGNVDTTISETTISLVFAYNKINNTGGYRKEAKGVGPLVKDFENYFITSIRSNQNIKLTPL